MSTQLSLFQFDDHQIRVGLTDSGDPYWVAADVCAALNIKNVGNALSRLEDDEKGDIRLPDVTARYQQIRVINEPGLYRLIFRSDAPRAKDFQRWMFHDVLPTIRKQGAYISPAITEQQLIDLSVRVNTLEKQLASTTEQLTTEYERAESHHSRAWRFTGGSHNS